VARPALRTLATALVLALGTPARAMPPVDATGPVAAPGDAVPASGAPTVANAPPLADPRGEALLLLARDDVASMDRALELLDEARRQGTPDVAADRALARLLAADALREEGSRSPEGARMLEGARRMREEALDVLRPLARERPRSFPVVRALAVYYGLEGNSDEVARLVTRARSGGEDDPWLAFAEVSAATRGLEPDAALPQLQAFTAWHPTLLRVRYLAARATLDAGHAAEALAATEALLLVNPDHGATQRLKAAILAPPPARVEAVPTPPRAPPPQAPGYLPRKSRTRP
jgi:predicted Zn-dependent protease